MKRYEQLTAHVAGLIRDGTLRCGERAPSVRELCRSRDTSPGTVVHAYELLSAQGYLQSRPRSGFYVSDAWRAADPQPRTSQPARRAAPPGVSDLVFQVLEAIRSREVVPLGSAFPGADLFPLQQLARDLAVAAQRLSPRAALQDLPPGNPQLHRQVAQRYALGGAQVSPDEIVITAGALEALNLCLQVLTRPGDVVAVESPAFYGCLQALENNQRRAVEVPTHPQHGVDVAALAQILERHPVRACWFMTTLHNPTGASMDPASRQRLVQLLAERDIPLVEDNVYADLQFDRAPGGGSKACDRRGLVLDCGSFSKSLAPGYRLGWVAAGRFAPAIAQRKIMTSVATSTPIQAAVARYLARGTYARHLRRLRQALQDRQCQFLAAMQRHLPPSMSWTRPAGGYLLWAQLPPGVDAIRLHHAALQHGISIAPGPMFSAHQQFRHAIRLNYGHPFTPQLDAALATLGRLIREA